MYERCPVTAASLVPGGTGRIPLLTAELEIVMLQPLADGVVAASGGGGNLADALAFGTAGSEPIQISMRRNSVDDEARWLRDPSRIAFARTAPSTFVPSTKGVLA